MMQPLLWSAAVLTVVIGIIHSWLGEVKLIGPLLAGETQRGMLLHSRFARRVLRFAWHVTSIAWWTLAAVFAILASAAPFTVTSSRILLALAAGFVLTGVYVLAAGRGRHLAWPLFMAIGVAAIVAALH